MPPIVVITLPRASHLAHKTHLESENRKRRQEEKMRKKKEDK